MVRQIVGFQRPRLWETGIIAAFALSVFGYWMLSETTIARYFMAGLAVVATLLTLTNKDRILFALLFIFTAGYSLMTLFLAQVAQAYVFFPIIAILGGLTLFFIEPAADSLALAVRAVGGLALAQMLWLLSPWPFDPASKAALAALFFYGLVNLLIILPKQKQTAFRIYGWFWFWIVTTLFVIIFYAEWQL